MKCTPLVLSIILFRRQKKVETWTQLNKVKLRIKSWQMTEEAEETKHKCMRYEERLGDCGPAPDTTHVKKWRNWPGHWRSEEDIPSCAQRDPDTRHGAISRLPPLTTTDSSNHICLRLHHDIALGKHYYKISTTAFTHYLQQTTETERPRIDRNFGRSIYSINIFVAVKQQFTPWQRQSSWWDLNERRLSKMVNLNAQSIKNYYFLVHQIYLYHAHV